MIAIACLIIGLIYIVTLGLWFLSKHKIVVEWENDFPRRPKYENITKRINNTAKKQMFDNAGKN